MHTTSTSTTAGKSTRQTSPDAIQLLTKDHKEVKALFQKYKKLASADGDASDRQKLAAQICTMLIAHSGIEKEIFYPAAREAGVEADLLDEAEVEHASVEELISQIQAMSPDEDLYDAKVTVLGEYVNHHVKEEEDEMFPKCRKAKMDL
ncbi:MAG TPA: hemerythrin domain-containing protein, partial [Burkholderiaceae bacterium]|nr:hemerythrin domain-containing protein [Burkholderiaceae bacterium]